MKKLGTVYVEMIPVFLRKPITTCDMWGLDPLSPLWIRHVKVKVCSSRESTCNSMLFHDILCVQNGCFLCRSAFMKLKLPYTGVRRLCYSTLTNYHYA